MDTKHFSDDSDEAPQTQHEGSWCLGTELFTHRGFKFQAGLEFCWIMPCLSSGFWKLFSWLKEMISGNGLVQPFLANDETALFRMELKRVIRKLSFSIASYISTGGSVWAWKDLYFNFPFASCLGWSQRLYHSELVAFWCPAYAGSGKLENGSICGMQPNPKMNQNEQSSIWRPGKIQRQGQVLLKFKGHWFWSTMRTASSKDGGTTRFSTGSLCRDLSEEWSVQGVLLDKL